MDIRAGGVCCFSIASPWGLGAHLEADSTVLPHEQDRDSNDDTDSGNKKALDLSQEKLEKVEDKK